VKKETGNEFTERVSRLLDNEQKHFTEPYRRMLKEAMTFGTDNTFDYHTSASLASIYTRVSTIRKEIYVKIDRIKRYYIVDLMLSQLVDDSLTPQVGTNLVVELGSDEEMIDEEMKALSDRIDLNAMVKDIAADLFSYGEYYLSTVIRPKSQVKSAPVVIPGHNPGLFHEAVQKSIIHEDMIIRKRIKTKIPNYQVSHYGLINVLDNVDQGKIVTLTYHGEVATYLMVNGKGDLEVREPADFIRFSLPGHRVRIDLHKEIEYLTQNSKMLKNPEILEKIPRYLRVGKSLIWPIIDKLGELEILEALVPATKLNKITTGSIVGFNVPAGMDVDRALEASKRLEGILNRKQGVDPTTGEMTVTEIMSAAGRIKTVPIFGEKGTLGPLNFHTNDPEDLLSSIQDLRRTICESIGIPYELIFKSEEQSKGQILKKYARYLRKLKGIQLALEEGLRQMAYIHLSNADLKFDEDKLYVKFFTPLVDVDNLDQLEFTDASVGILANLLGFIQTLQEIPFMTKRVNPKAVTEYINAQLGTVGLDNILYTDEELKKMGIDPNEVNKAPPTPTDMPPPAGGVPPLANAPMPPAGGGPIAPPIPPAGPGGIQGPVAPPVT